MHFTDTLTAIRLHEIGICAVLHLRVAACRVTIRTDKHAYVAICLHEIGDCTEFRAARRVPKDAIHTHAPSAIRLQ